MIRASFAVLAALALVSTACPRPARTPALALGDSHATTSEGAPAEQPAGALTLEEAEAALARSLSGPASALALAHAHRVSATGGNLAAEQRAAITRIIDALPGAALDSAYRDMQPGVYPAPLVALRLALLAAHRGDERAARRWLARSQGAAELVGKDAVAALADRLATMSAPVDVTVIVAALPMSGPHALIGNEIAAAIRLAERDAKAASGAIKPARILIEDTRGQAEGALAAIERAASVHHALAVLGPVGDKESLSAARRASELGLPIALLSPGAPSAAPRAGVFRLWSSPGWEAGQAAHLAIALGHDRLAVLAPRDEHGALAARAFSDAARAEGLGLVARGSYDPTASDLEPDIKAFLGLDPARNPRLQAHLRRQGKKGWKTFTPDVPFDLLYIPDDYQRAALVASYLPYFNVEVRSHDLMDAVALRRKYRGRVPQVVQLLGSSGWHHEGLLPRGGSTVEGALVVDVFAGGENEAFASDDAARFAQRFHDAGGHWPTALAAQAHDAALLLLTARQQALAAMATDRASPSGQNSGRVRPGELTGVRAALVRALTGAGLDGGVCGPVKVTATGELAREAVLLRVDGGSFVPHEY